MKDIHPQEWHDARTKGLGGSEIGNLFAPHKDLKYSCGRRLFYSKVGKKPDYKDRFNPILERGHVLEPIIAKKFYSHFLDYVEADMEEVLPLLKSKEFNENDFLIGNPDGIFYDNFRKEFGVLEIKSCNEWVFKKLGSPKLSHEMQVQWYMAVTGLKKAYIAYGWADGWQFRFFEIPRNEALIQEMLKKGKYFWELVKENKSKELSEPPNLDFEEPPIDLEILKPSSIACKGCVFRKNCGLEIGIEVDKSNFVKEEENLNHEDIYNMVKEFLAISTEGFKLETRKNILEYKIKEYLGENEILELEDVRIVWEKSKDSKIDYKLLKEKYPLIAEEMIKENITRSFSISHIKNTN